MLYVFHVNTGRMLTLDMSTALDTVHILKETIKRLTGIANANQVLLISGGETLRYDSKVFSYSAGTDTNPIFMFSTNNLDEPPIVAAYREETNFKEIVRQCQHLQPTYSTVVKRAQIAQEMATVGEEETKRCNEMVYEQHLQQQGWMAVVANMEDMAKEFKQRFTDFYTSLDEHLVRRPEYLNYLSNFEHDLSVLDKIPISPGLVKAAHQSFTGFGNLFDNHDSFIASMQEIKVGEDEGLTMTVDRQSSSVETKTSSGSGSSLTLLQWLTAKDALSTLRDLPANCVKIIDMFDANSIKQLKTTVESTINQSRQESMREIRGVESRFQGLDVLMCNANKLVKEQCKIAAAFQQNQTRASDLGDASIFPDLCESHQGQLGVMLSNYTKLADFHRRIYASKEELSSNLVQRIKFLVQLQNRICEQDCKMLFYNRCLRRVQRHLAVIEQIHDAPSMYVQAISEVIRRKTFSTCFVKWSSNLVANWSGLYNEEINRRQEFSNKFEGHFLNSLFTGLEDIPPAYAIHEPNTFDANLPNITINDMSDLSNIIPEGTLDVTLPDLTAVTQFFMTHNQRVIRDLQTASENGSLEPYPKPTDVLHHLKDACDSETDTEEFEKVDKVVSIPCEKVALNASTSTHIETVNTETLTDDYTNGDLDRMRGLLREMYHVCIHSFGLLRERLRDFKEDSLNDRQCLEQQFKEMVGTWEHINKETRNETNSCIERLTSEHASEVAALRSQMLENSNTVNSLRSEMVDLNMMKSNAAVEFEDQKAQMVADLSELNQRLEVMQCRLVAADTDKQQAVHEARETMLRSHKTEIESLRSRFKLMTNMERSPSDTSLEKIDRAECSEAPQFDIENVQTTQPRAATKMMLSHSPKSPSKSSSDMYRQILYTKDQELETLRQRQKVLEAENKHLCDRMEAIQIVGRQPLDTVIELEPQELSMDKLLQKELDTKRDLSTSAIAAASPSGRVRGMYCKRMVCIDQCSKGDTVLVIWNPTHNQYTIFQDNPILYFLHAESHTGLNLELPSSSGQSSVVSSSSASPAAQPLINPTPSPPKQTMAAIGKVIDKEYCYARKDENRYKVQRGTKFYRVKVSPRTQGNCSDPAGKCCSKRSRLDSDPTSLVSTSPGMSASTSTSTRPHSFISSFAQTDGEPIGSPVTSDMVDMGVMPLPSMEPGDDVFKELPGVKVAAGDDDFHMSSESSLYQTFDEVYELDNRHLLHPKDVALESKPPETIASRSSSSASDTAPMAVQSMDGACGGFDCVDN